MNTFSKRRGRLTAMLLFAATLGGCQHTLDIRAIKICRISPKYSSFMNNNNSLKVVEKGNYKLLEYCISTTIQSDSKLVEVSLSDSVDEVFSICRPLIVAYAKEIGMDSGSSDEFDQLVDEYKSSIKRSLEFSRKYQC